MFFHREEVVFIHYSSDGEVYCALKNAKYIAMPRQFLIFIKRLLSASMMIKHQSMAVNNYCECRDLLKVSTQ